MFKDLIVSYSGKCHAMSTCTNMLMDLSTAVYENVFIFFTKYHVGFKSLIDIIVCVHMSETSCLALSI